mgnify:CR=1 FL=1
MVNAQRVFLKENSHFLQDRPHGPVFLFENPPMMHFQIRNRWYKKISPGPGRDTWSGHLVGTPGRDTWSGHLVGTPTTSMSPSGSGGLSSSLPSPQAGNTSHSLTHTTYIHTERHHKNPKDKSFGKIQTKLRELVSIKKVHTLES